MMLWDIFGARESMRTGNFHPLPVLTLLDLQLPGLKGPQVLEALRKQLSSSLCPVVILSADTDLEQVQESYRLGAASFLIKPVTVPDLLNLLRNLPRLASRHTPATRPPTSSPLTPHP